MQPPSTELWWILDTSNPNTTRRSFMVHTRHIKTSKSWPERTPMAKASKKPITKTGGSKLPRFFPLRTAATPVKVALECKTWPEIPCILWTFKQLNATEKPEFAALLKDKIMSSKVVYRADIFGHLNNSMRVHRGMKINSLHQVTNCMGSYEKLKFEGKSGQQ